MSEKKQTKNLELFEDENSNLSSRKDAKELNLDENPDSNEAKKSTNETDTTNDSIANELETKNESVSNDDDSSQTETLFDEKTPKSKENTKGSEPKEEKHASADLNKSERDKENQKRIFKIVLIVLIVLVVLTGIIVGSLAAAGVGVFGEKSTINIPGMGTWIESHSKDENKEEEILSIYEDRATLYYYDTLGAQNLLFIEPNNVQTVKEKLVTDKQEQINTEKENFRKSEGKNWKEAWDKNLIEKGFATSSSGGEEQYLDSLVSSELKQYVVDAFTGNGYLTSMTEVIPASEKDNFDFISSEFDNGGASYVYAIKNGTNSGVKNNVDVESLFKFYLDYSKPISFKEIVAPMTVSNYDKTHTIDDNSNVNFATTDDLQTFVDAFKQENIIFDNFGEATNSFIWLNDFEIPTSGGDDGSGTEQPTEASAFLREGGEMTPQDAIFTTQLLTASTDNTTDWANSGALKGAINTALSDNGVDINNSNSISGLSEAQLYDVGKAIGEALKTNGGDLITTGWNINVPEVDAGSTGKYPAYKMTVALESDGFHFIKWNGFDATTTTTNYVDNNVDYALGKAYFQNDIDVLRDLKNGESYELFDSFRDWVGSNYKLLILNSAYEEGINLENNDQYPEWDDILSGSDIDMTQLEKTLYGDSFLEMFANYANRKINYTNYLDKYLGVTPGAEFEENVKNTIYTPSGWLDPGAELQEWNFFRINLDKTVVSSPSKDDAFGAIKIFTKATKGGSK